MKRITAILLALLIGFSFTACKSKNTRIVEDLIAKIDPENITLRSENIIVEAEQAYEILELAERYDVENYSILTDARKKLDILLKADSVDKLIDAIDKGRIGVDDKDDIEAASKAYDALSDEEKKAVKNADKLKTAKKDLEQAIKKQEEAEKLTAEEEYAVQYLVTYSKILKNPHSLKVYNAWCDYFSIDKYQNYYFTFELGATNSFGGEMESIIGNYMPLDGTQKNLDDAYDLYLIDAILGNESIGIPGDFYFGKDETTAKDDGHAIRADKIQEAYDKAIANVK